LKTGGYTTLLATEQPYGLATSFVSRDSRQHSLVYIDRNLNSIWKYFVGTNKSISIPCDGLNLASIYYDTPSTTVVVSRFPSVVGIISATGQLLSEATFTEAGLFNIGAYNRASKTLYLFVRFSANKII
jgi:hypothetical protein